MYVCIRFHMFSVHFISNIIWLKILCAPEMVVRILSCATRRKILRCIIDLPNISRRMHMHGKIFYCVAHGISMPLITNVIARSASHSPALLAIIAKRMVGRYATIILTIHDVALKIARILENQNYIFSLAQYLHHKCVLTFYAHIKTFPP